MSEKTERNIFLTSIIILAVIAFLYHRKKGVPASALGPIAASTPLDIPQAGEQPVFTAPDYGTQSSEDYPLDEIPMQNFSGSTVLPSVNANNGGCACGGNCGDNAAAVTTSSNLLSSLSNPNNPIVAAFFNPQNV